MNLKNLARLYQEVDDMLYYALPFENHPSVDEDHNRILVRKYAEGITKVVNVLAPVADEMGFFKELYK